MSRWWSNASIRVRLTAWYMAVLSLMLIVYATATFLAVRHEFREQLERELHEHVEAASPEPEAALEERLQQQLREILVVLVLGLPLIVALAGLGFAWRGYGWLRFARFDHRSIRLRARRASYAQALAEKNGGRVL